ncbi:hypothetical protein LIER_36529 [Lithospermum erythrorhizon]|uniref:Peptidase C14 caspase domain-containing protein n=1 Tax=Lithospermum erythrorhizon TaxID=34254 RepID=A0AAV3P7M3_LITER
MVTRQEKCKWCNANMFIPFNATTLTCQQCRSVTVLPPAISSNGTSHPSANTANSNINAARPYANTAESNINSGRPSANTTDSNINASHSSFNRAGSNINASRPSFNRADSNINASRPPAINTNSNGNSNTNAAPNIRTNVINAISAHRNSLWKSVAKVQQTVNKVQQVQSFLRAQAALVPPAQIRRRAVLCGVTYKGNPKALKGSINDVLSMKRFLIEKMEFPHSSIFVLTEDEKDPSRIPTKANIRAALRWLVQGCQAGDSLVFHYSGHGSRVRDQDGDELDGHDSALCPVDYEVEGRIIDDEINETIVRPLPRGATLLAIVDTCFSGTFLDLPYMCRVKGDGYYLWQDHRISHAYKGTNGGLAISLSACDDHQTSGDTTVFTGTSTGALTYSFIQTLEKDPKLTYGRVLIAMRDKVQGAQKTIGQKGSDTQMQDPQLSASEQFDIHAKLLVL